MHHVASRAGFNEAAANGRGKPTNMLTEGPSMVRFNEAAANGRGKRPCAGRGARATPRASMRPRRMAAENVRHDAGRVRRALPASMRPRRMAAENAVRAAEEPRGLAASMRPRRMAAENGDDADVVYQAARLQ